MSTDSNPINATDIDRLSSMSKNKTIPTTTTYPIRAPVPQESNEAINHTHEQDDLLTKYIKEVNSFEILDKETEQELAKLYIENNDIDAANRLTKSYLRLVVKMALKYKKYGLPMMDVIAEGNLGLMRAVRGFNPNLGYRLSTYAMWWITASINDFILKSWSIVKIGTTTMQRKLFFSFHKIKAKLGIQDTKQLDDRQIEMITKYTGATKQDINDMQMRLLNPDSSTDAPNNFGTPICDTMSDVETGHPEVDFEQKTSGTIIRNALKAAFDTLSPREKKIIYSRLMQDDKSITLEELAREFSISPERVRQITNSALKKMKKELENEQN